jgi:hypothetical protein
MDDPLAKLDQYTKAYEDERRRKREEALPLIAEKRAKEDELFKPVLDTFNIFRDAGIKAKGGSGRPLELPRPNESIPRYKYAYYISDTYCVIELYLVLDSPTPFVYERSTYGQPIPYIKRFSTSDELLDYIIREMASQRAR